MKKNDKFEFLIYRENFLSGDECDKIIEELTVAENAERLKEGDE